MLKVKLNISPPEHVDSSSIIVGSEEMEKHHSSES